MAELITARRYQVRGRVQGVGFRNFAQRTAHELGLTGWVWNMDDGSVGALAQGTAESLNRFERQLRIGPAWAEVKSVESQEEPPISAQHFAITHRPR